MIDIHFEFDSDRKFRDRRLIIYMFSCPICHINGEFISSSKGNGDFEISECSCGFYMISQNHEEINFHFTTYEIVPGKQVDFTRMPFRPGSGLKKTFLMVDYDKTNGSFSSTRFKDSCLEEVNESIECQFLEFLFLEEQWLACKALQT